MCRRFSEANTPGDIFHFVVAGTVLWAKITGMLTKRKRKVVEGVYISTTEVDSLRAIVRVKTLSRRPRREQMSVQTQIRAPGQIYDIKELFYGTWRWLAVPWLRGRWPPCDGNPPRLTMTPVWDEIGCAISFRVQSLSPVYVLRMRHTCLRELECRHLCILLVLMWLLLWERKECREK